jgi:hypothetical protein
MSKQITIEASSLGSARTKALSEHPKNWVILSERIISEGKQNSVSVQAQTTEKALLVD